MILDPDDYEAWLTGTPDEAFVLIKPFLADRVVIHQSDKTRKATARAA
jgi:putative SOS response-associated peptidase YedK